MLNRLKRLKRCLASLRPGNAAAPTCLPPAGDPWESMASRPLSLDAELAIASGRITEQRVRQVIRENVRKFRESSAANPASLWALSFVDPYDWALDTPDFYPGFGAMGGWGVPWMLNNQGRGDVLPVYINEYGLKLIRDWSRKILAFNEFALNAVENRISYIVGKGFQYTVLPKKKPALATPVGKESGTGRSALVAKAQAVLDEFVSRQRWCEREQECVRRCDRDGEAILRFFHLGQGLASVRFVEPECLTDEQGRGAETNYGVVTAPGDIEDVRGYEIVENPSSGTWATSFVPARDVLHIKLNTDFDAKRGLPTLFPVRKNLERADKLLRNMSIMGQVQATFAVIRKHKRFSPSSVQAFQQNQTDVSVTSPVSGRALSMQQFYPGSVIDSSDQTEYEFPSANIDASGLVAVLQAELRAIAARMVMPEWMLTVDASNGNFAGQLVGGAPSVEKFKRDQAFFARRFGDGEYGDAEVGGGQLAGAMWRVLAIAVEGGLLPAQTLTDLEIQAEGPSITVVNKSAETIRARNLYEAGLLSPETWSKWEGLDRQQELALGAKPQARPQPPSSPGNGGMPASAPPGSAIGAGIEEALLLEARANLKTIFGRCYDLVGRKVISDSPCPGKEETVRPNRNQREKEWVKHVLTVYNHIERGNELRRRVFIHDAMEHLSGHDHDENLAGEVLLAHLVGGEEHIGGTGLTAEGTRKGIDVAVGWVPAGGDSKLLRSRDKDSKSSIYHHTKRAQEAQSLFYEASKKKGKGTVPYQVVFQLHPESKAPAGVYFIPGIPQTDVDLAKAKPWPPAKKLHRHYGEAFLVWKAPAGLEKHEKGHVKWQAAAFAILSQDRKIHKALHQLHQRMHEDIKPMRQRTDEVAREYTSKKTSEFLQYPNTAAGVEEAVVKSPLGKKLIDKGRAQGCYQSALKFGKSQTEAVEFARQESGLKDWTPRS